MPANHSDHSDSLRFFDLQVNGYAGVDFNSTSLTIDDLRHACQQFINDGGNRFLATIITDAPEIMAMKLATIAELCQADELVADVVAGIHIEGPFLNPADACVGAHPKEFVIAPDLDVMKRLLEAADGLVKIVTFAPELEGGDQLVRFLSDRNVTASAGHCDPTRDQLASAIDAGLKMFTHVGNGCALKQNRHDNIIQRVLSLSDRIWCCFIADGVHVPAFALKNYLAVAGIERSIVVSDAMSAAGLGPGKYKLGSIDVSVDDQHRAELAGGDGRLAGSVATLPLLQKVLCEEVGLSEQEIDKLLYENPIAAIKLKS